MAMLHVIELFPIIFPCGFLYVLDLYSKDDQKILKEFFFIHFFFLKKAQLFRLGSCEVDVLALY